MTLVGLVSTNYTVDAGDVEFAFTVPQPTVRTSTISISDWDDTGYRAAIVLALVEAEVAGNDITVDPVTPLAGELDVATDLTIDNVERRNAGVNIRLRRTGAGAFSTYMDNEGSPQYPDAKMFMVVEDGANIEQIPFTIGNTGSGASNWTIDDSNGQAPLIAGIATGDRFVLAIAEPVVAYAVNAGDVDWTVATPQPTVTHTPRAADTFAVDAGDADWAFALPQPTVTLTGRVSDDYNVDAGDIAFAFALPEPTVTHTARVPDTHAVNAGTVSFAWTLPQPTVDLDRSISVDAGNVSWVFAIPQPTASTTFPTVTITTAAQTVDAGGVVSLSATSSDPDGTVDTYAWTGMGYFVDAAVEDATWQAPYPGSQTTYTLTLTVTDNDGNMADATVDMTVRAAPTGTIQDIYGNETASFTGQTVTNNAI